MYVNLMSCGRPVWLLRSTCIGFDRICFFLGVATFIQNFLSNGNVGLMKFYKLVYSNLGTVHALVLVFDLALFFGELYFRKGFGNLVSI